MKRNKKPFTISDEFNLSQHIKALRLVEGSFVWHDGHFIGAKKVITDEYPCYLCKMDSICHLEMADLCAECDYLGKAKYILYLVAYRDNH